MSGYDKYNLLVELKSKGWTEDPAAPPGTWRLFPPAEVLRKLEQRSYYVYDARDLQEMADESPDPA